MKIAIRETRIWFNCPGCKERHGITTSWSFNGNADAPTFQPSILVSGVKWSAFPDNHLIAEGAKTICHSFITDGQIMFLTDSTHALAGQTVELPDLDQELLD